MKTNHNEPHTAGNAWSTTSENTEENTEEMSPMQFDGEMPLNEATSSPKYPRNLWCKHYDACLDVAVARDWQSFSCEACGNRFKGLKRIFDIARSEPVAPKDYQIPERIPGLPEEIRLSDAVISTEEAFQNGKVGTLTPFKRLPSKGVTRRYDNVARKEYMGRGMYVVRVATPEGVTESRLFEKECAATAASLDILQALVSRRPSRSF